MTGIIARGACSVPWESELRRLRSDGARPEKLNACLGRAAEEIVAAVRETPPDANLKRQVRYYCRHYRLRFASLFKPTPPVVAA